MPIHHSPNSVKTRVHLCCGTAVRKGWINVDIIDFGQEVIANLNEKWEFLEDDAVELIVCKDGFEHQKSVEHFLAESERVLKPGGTLEIWVPHFKNPSAYRVTHRHLLSWSYFDAYPEPHDATQQLRVISNRLFIGRKNTILLRPFHFVANTSPKWWERLFYVSNIEVVFQKLNPTHTS